MNSEGINIINLIAIGAAILVLIIYGLSISIFRKKSGNTLNVAKRLSKSLNTSDKSEEAKLSLLKVDPDTYFKSKLPKIETLKEWIQHSGLDINPILFVTVSIVIGMIAFLIFIALHINILISLLLGVITSFTLPWAFITFLASQRRKQFLEDFPIALDIIRRSLRAGQSIDRSLTIVVEEVTGPVGEAFKRLVEQFTLGTPFEKALGDLANRLGINEFRILAIVMVLQRETGGSLAEAMDNFSKIIRARQTLRKKVKALTAEVRVTAAILVAIPFGIFGVVYVTTPHYFDPLFYTGRGQIVLLVGILMLLAGIGLIVRMTYKENY